LELCDVLKIKWRRLPSPINGVFYRGSWKRSANIKACVFPIRGQHAAAPEIKRP
jgi:hypothetical protein